MRRLFVLFSCFIISFSVLSQQRISGRVVNSETGAAIPGSSVFISNTSKGTSTDNNGQFELNDIPPGKHDLVISSIGYETLIHPFSNEQLPIRLKVELNIKVRELENVTVEPWVEEGWDKWGKLFMENFIGFTENASRCQILNRDIIRFRYFKNSNRLIAYADQPLIIDNRLLGYKITYQLENFELNFNQRSAVFLGYSLFQSTADGKKAVARRRREAYYGSIMHFLRSLYVDSLAENGFEVRRMKRYNNLEKQRVRAIYKSNRIMTTNRDNGSQTVSIEGPALAADSITYYRQVFQQPDYTDVYGKDILKADSLFIGVEQSHRLLYFTDYISVTFKEALEEPEYLRTQMQNRKRGPQQSMLYLPEMKAIWVASSGNYFDPQQLYSLGYWSWKERIGDNLPLDYDPHKD